MAIVRKTLSKPDSPHIMALKKLIETQSKESIARWCVSYAREEILPIYRKSYPADERAEAALDAALEWLEGKVKLPEVRQHILAAHAAAREAEGDPAAQAAMRAAAHAASVVHAPSHSIGLAYYGAAALVYAKAGLEATPEVYAELARQEVARMEEALAKTAIPDEKNPARIHWTA